MLTNNHHQDLSRRTLLMISETQHKFMVNTCSYVSNIFVQTAFINSYMDRMM